MSTRRRVVLLVVAGQFLLLVGLIAWQEYKLHFWQTIRLRVQPVDPVALFRGRYVDLAYDFSTLETTEAGLKEGDTVYVRLKPGEEGLWRYAGFTTKREPQPGSVLLRGEAVSTWRRGAWIRTGIESYFLSERQAPAIERLSRVQYKMTVDVVVADDGRAALKQLYVEGIPAEKVDPRTVRPTLSTPAVSPGGTRAQGRYELVTGKAFEGAVPDRFYLEGNAIPTQKRNAALVKTSRGVRVLFALLDTRRYSSQLQEKYKGMVISEGYISFGRQCGGASGVLSSGSHGFGLWTPPAGSSEDAKFFLYDQGEGGLKFGELCAKRDPEIKQPRPLQVVVDKGGSARLYLGRYWLELQ